MLELGVQGYPVHTCPISIVVMCWPTIRCYGSVLWNMTCWHSSCAMAVPWLVKMQDSIFPRIPRGFLSDSHSENMRIFHGPSHVMIVMCRHLHESIWIHLVQKSMGSMSRTMLWSWTRPMWKATTISGWSQFGAGCYMVLRQAEIQPGYNQPI